MSKQKVDINIEVQNGDFVSAEVAWWGPDEVFIAQLEKNRSSPESIMFTRAEAIELYAALGTFLGVIHDSDCAQHNMPAYPNGPCDCSITRGAR